MYGIRTSSLIYFLNQNLDFHVFQIGSGQNYRCLTNDGLAAYKKLEVPKVKKFRVEEG